MRGLIRLRRAYGRLLAACGVLAGLSAFAMMLLVVYNALARFLFNAPLAGTLEITESLLTVLIFASLALTQYEGGHIRVVLLTDRLGPGLRRLANVLAMLAGTLLFAWCALAAWEFALKSWAMDEHEWGAVRFPLYPVKFVCALGLSLLTIQFLLDALLAAAGARLPGQHASEPAHTAGTTTP